MAGIRVEVKYGKITQAIEFCSVDATVGDLREQIEQQMSVPRASQSLICSGRRWQGVAFGDELKLTEAARNSAKDVMGVKVISGVMLMAPPDCDGSAAVKGFEEKVVEVNGIIQELAADADPEDVRKQLKLADDLLTRAAEGLDGLTLVGAQRERRRELLRQIDSLGNDVEKRRCNL
mmetsp:Transcript_111869/g.316049  ORF Transcript_111869/g.316049 Transcript_111869/m.316049 type:complete len:177 (-) Transcript_111869:88-618(-)